MHEPPTRAWKPYVDVLGRPDSTVVGDVVVLPDLASPQLGVSRDVLVLLPDGARTSGRRYPVLYLHDGQNVFDAATSFAGEWQADETLAGLAREGIEVIAVAIPNGGERRFDEYTPFGFAAPPGGEVGADGRRGGLGSAYLAFLVETVKPLVDTSFPTRPEREATGILGSSLGGLISLWAAVTHGGTFGLIGAMSPGIPRGQHAILDRLQRARPVPVRAYVDMGMREISHAPTDAVTRRWQAGFVRNVDRTREALRIAGLLEPDDLRVVVDPDGRHHESDWARRLPDALRFLFGPLAAGR